MDGTHRTRGACNEEWEGKRQFEHWYRDNQVYFTTASVSYRRHVFTTPETSAIFWDRFDHYTTQHHFTPWVTSLLSNHYHTLGYLRRGEDLGPMMRKLHGSTAKLANDLLPDRIKPFWRDESGQDYFDGCIRDEKQCRAAFRYVLTQSARHRVARDPHAFPNTRVNVDLERGVRRALELNAFLSGVRYKRYER